MSILAYEACRLSPADRLGRLRRCEANDVRILTKLTEVQAERQKFGRSHDEFETEVRRQEKDAGRKRVPYGVLAADKLRCLREVAAQRILSPKETILKASYRTRGKKARQEELFEDLKKEVEERRKSLGAPTK